MENATAFPRSEFKPEIVELLVAHLECTEEHACDLIERAVYGGSLEDIKSGSSPAQVRVEQRPFALCGHPNALGHKIIAEKVVEFIKRNQILQVVSP